METKDGGQYFTKSIFKLKSNCRLHIFYQESKQCSLIAINFSQKSPHFSLLSSTSPCDLFEREVTSPSNLKVVRALV